MMALNGLIFIFISISAIDSKTCSRKISFVSGGATINQVEYYCCANSYSKNGTCEICPVGYATNQEGTDCDPCPDGQYGSRCAYACFCKQDERCNNIYGCVSEDPHNMMVNLTDHKILFGFSRKDFRIAVYAGCSGLVLVIFCVLVGYGCYIKGNQHAANVCVSTLTVNNVSSYNMQTPLQRSCPEAEENRTNHGEIEAIPFYTDEPAMMKEDNENDGNEYWNKDIMEGSCDNYLIPFETMVNDSDEFRSFSKENEKPTVLGDKPFDPIYLNLYQPLNHQSVQHHYTELQ